MILVKDFNNFKNMTDAFNSKLKVEEDKKYKLPNMQRHYFRKETLLMNSKWEYVYLSTWDSKVMNIDFKRISYTVMEYPKSFAMIIHN